MAEKREKPWCMGLQARTLLFSKARPALTFVEVRARAQMEARVTYVSIFKSSAMLTVEGPSLQGAQDESLPDSTSQ